MSDNRLKGPPVAVQLTCSGGGGGGSAVCVPTSTPSGSGGGASMLVARRFRQVTRQAAVGGPSSGRSALNTGSGRSLWGENRSGAETGIQERKWAVRDGNAIPFGKSCQ